MLALLLSRGDGDLPCCRRERDVKKVYCALSVGRIPAGTIQVDGPIGQSPREK